MKKTLIASAIAAAAISTSAFAEGNMPTLYGNMQLVYTNTDADVQATTGGATTSSSSNGFGDNGSTFGIMHEHEISPGITGFMKAEFEYSAGEGKGAGNGITNIDEAYLGAKGSFGSVQVGSDDTVYEWVNPLDFTEATSFTGDLAGMQESKNIQYYSPEIAGGLTVGLTLPIASESVHSGALGATYATDMFEVSLAYALGGNNGGAEQGDSIGLAGTVNLGDLAVIAQYETKSADTAGGVDDKRSEIDLMGLAAIYSLGASQFAIGYITWEDSEDTNTGEYENIYLQALHNFSDNLYGYVEYTMETKDNLLNDDETARLASNEVNTLYVGATYTF